ncbi:DUF6629 family protein [Herbaspirillum sp. ST 5-3]|uniref:DUF6629 family protein n=1 Tax=Oxalobacteraceae TaxID=75682 RepID=UPI0010A4D0FE|nr:DUF6629 family protein [Herbaspirillum sp. ST 5-3]
MCFSATASFVAGVSLSAIGGATLKRARRRTEIPFALIPLLFGIQQIIEGLLWLSFRYHAPVLNATTTYAFSVFSHTLWPIFVPFSVGLLEPVTWRKNIISAFQILGLGIGLYLLYFIVKYPVTAVAEEHIVYVSPHFYQIPAMLLYLAATCVVSFFSSHRLVKVFGALALVLFFVAYWFYTAALFSVWCFFSAVLSAIIYLYFRANAIRRAQVAGHR